MALTKPKRGSTVGNNESLTAIFWIQITLGLKMKLGILAALAGSFLFPQAANAGVFSINSLDLGLSATITTSDLPDSLSGGYDITGIAGTVTGFGNITGLIDIADRTINPTPPGPYTADFGIVIGGEPFLVSYDNLFFTTMPQFDAFGIVFQLESGKLAVLGCVGSGTCEGANYELLVGSAADGVAADRVGSLVVTSVAAIPEASTWSMIIIGFLGLGFMFHGRNRLAQLPAG